MRGRGRELRGWGAGVLAEVTARTGPRAGRSARPSRASLGGAEDERQGQGAPDKASRLRFGDATNAHRGMGWVGVTRTPWSRVGAGVGRPAQVRPPHAGSHRLGQSLLPLQGFRRAVATWEGVTGDVGAGPDEGDESFRVREAEGAADDGAGLLDAAPDPDSRAAVAPGGGDSRPPECATNVEGGPHE